MVTIKDCQARLGEAIVQAANDPSRHTRASLTHDLHFVLSAGSMIEPANRSMPVTDADLVRFSDAQSDVHEQVADELTKGRKRTHWMWFIFPQLEGLGHGSMVQRYAIRDLDQARRYLAHPLLGRRLRHNVRLDDRFHESCQLS